MLFYTLPIHKILEASINTMLGIQEHRTPEHIHRCRDVRVWNMDEWSEAEL